MQEGLKSQCCLPLFPEEALLPHLFPLFPSFAQCPGFQSQYIWGSRSGSQQRGSDVCGVCGSGPQPKIARRPHQEPRAVQLGARDGEGHCSPAQGDVSRKMSLWYRWPETACPQPRLFPQGIYREGRTVPTTLSREFDTSRLWEANGKTNISSVWHFNIQIKSRPFCHERIKDDNGWAVELAAALEQTAVCLWDCNKPAFPKHFVLVTLAHQCRACDKEPPANPINTNRGIDLMGTAPNQ